MERRKPEVNIRVKKARPQAAFTETSAKLRIAGILHESLVDGPGIRTVLFTQGCPHACNGCHSASTWDINGGEEKELSEVANEVLSYKNLDGLTISGGEPIAQSDTLAALIELLRLQKPDLNIWLYSGYKIEELAQMAKYIESVRKVLTQVDVLIDGKYVQELRDIALRFRGSKNQNIITRQHYLPLLQGTDILTQTK